MFVCAHCHRDGGCGSCFGMASHGRCENCGNDADCIGCRRVNFSWLATMERAGYRSQLHSTKEA